jgi:hypothetical protein
MFLKLTELSYDYLMDLLSIYLSKLDKSEVERDYNLLKKSNFINLSSEILKDIDCFKIIKPRKSKRICPFCFEAIKKGVKAIYSEGIINKEGNGNWYHLYIHLKCYTKFVLKFKE